MVPGSKRRVGSMLVTFLLFGSVVAHGGDDGEQGDAASLPAAASIEITDTPVESMSPAGPQNVPSGGLVATIDPKTGELTESEVPPDLAAADDPWLSNALSTSSDGLVEVPTPEGGWMVDLQGRFQNVLFATVGRTGAASVTHLEPTTLPGCENAAETRGPQASSSPCGGDAHAPH